jgi:hypothetical protein
MTTCTDQLMPTVVNQKISLTWGIISVTVASRLIYPATAIGTYSELSETQKGQCEANCLRSRSRPIWQNIITVNYWQTWWDDDTPTAIPLWHYRYQRHRPIRITLSPRWSPMEPAMSCASWRSNTIVLIFLLGLPRRTLAAAVRWPLRIVWISSVWVWQRILGTSCVWRWRTLGVDRRQQQQRSVQDDRGSTSGRWVWRGWFATAVPSHPSARNLALLWSSAWALPLRRWRKDAGAGRDWVSDGLGMWRRVEDGRRRGTGMDAGRENSSALLRRMSTVRQS